MSETTTTTLSVGTRVEVHAENVPHLANSRYLGQPGTIERVNPIGDFTVKFDDESLQANNWGTWTSEALRVIEEAPAAPGRPLVDFSGTSRKTAREYAEAANSRVLEESSQKVLKAASMGRSVDAYALNAAITDAMRSCSTRLGQSMARRDLNRKVAYLGHICQAVLENHADNLPTYEPGARSRKIEELSLEIEHAGLVNQALTRDLTEERKRREQAQNHYLGVSQQVENQDRRIADLIREKSAVEVEIDDLKMAASAERRRLCKQVDDNAKIALEALHVLTYAFERMDKETQERVLGFWDGVSGS